MSKRIHNQGVAALLLFAVGAHANGFHSDFSEASLGDIAGLNRDAPGAPAQDFSLNTTDETLDFATANADMWITRAGAPIAWVAAPIAFSGEVWSAETYLSMEKDGSNSSEVAGITFYGAPDGVRPDFSFGLDDWNGWHVRLQGLGDNDPNVASVELGTATGVFLRTEITEGGAEDTYNFFYKINSGDDWIQLGGNAINYPSSIANSRVGLFLKSSAMGGAAQFDFFTVTPPPSAVIEVEEPSNIRINAATLTGNLIRAGSEPSDVWFCWGTTDADEDLAGWEQRTNLGNLPQGPFALNVSNLISDTDYVYRCAASNENQIAWSGAQSFTTSRPRIAIVPVQVVEGNQGTTQAVFTVRLSCPYPEPVSFTFSTVDGTAGAADYAAQNGERTFLAGQTELQITVTVHGDVDDEADEDFFLQIQSSGIAAIENGTARGMILSDERTDYLSPSELVADEAAQLLYVAESSAGRIGVIDLTSDTLVGSIDLPNNPSGLTLSADGATLYVTAGIATGVVHVVDTASNQLLKSITVGHSPRSPVWASSNRLYVCQQFDNAVSVVDLTLDSVAGSIPVLREPFGATLTSDGSKLLVANLLPHQASTADHSAASVSVIDTASGTVDQHILLAPGSHSPRGVAISPDGHYAVVAHTLGRYRIPTTQIFRGWVNTSALSIIDLTSMTLASTVLLDDLDLGAANPWGMAFASDGSVLSIAHAGTHELSAIDWPALLTKLALNPGDHSVDLTFLVGLRRRIPLPGKGPRDVVMVGSNVYAATYFSASVAVADITPGQEYAAHEIAIGWKKPRDAVRQGQFYYYDARLSAQQWQSCTSCHPGTRNDGLNWDLLNDGFGNAKNTKSMLHAHETAPTTITGIRANAEVSVLAGLRYSHFVNHTNAENVEINAFLRAQRPVPSPHLKNGALSAAAVRGQALFTSTGCMGCHNGPYLTDQALHDVGTGIGREAGTHFDTPTLIEVWRTGPYLYDGRAETMRDVLTTFNPAGKHGSTSGLSEAELDDLEAYINSL
ncbi:MAG: c-type cytochrome [Verrucomicrobia bacterium]|jgi:YVTN family beta-propeller protein|nr:c-type cytochrome [Verrucomicrobiota bacterium]